MIPEGNVRLVQFDCVEKPIPKGTVAEPRPPARPRQTIAGASDHQSAFHCFDCDAVGLPPETKAAPRPHGRERRNLAGTESTTNLAAIVEESAPFHPAKLSTIATSETGCSK